MKSMNTEIKKRVNYMKFKNFKGLIFLLIISLTLFSSCSGNANTEETQNTTIDTTETSINNSLTYEQISGEDAKRLMDTEADFIIVDARTEEEFNEGHIEGAKTFRRIGEFAVVGVIGLSIDVECISVFFKL